jgi:hypothetical protein
MALRLKAKCPAGSVGAGRTVEAMNAAPSLRRLGCAAVLAAAVSVWGGGATAYASGGDPLPPVPPGTPQCVTPM